MTRTALENRKIESSERIAEEDRKHKRSENAKQRKWQSEENRKDRVQKYVASGAQVLSSAAKMIPNDPEWYKRYIKDLKDFVNVPTYERLGSTKYSGRYRAALGRAGICTYLYEHTVGPQTSVIPSDNPVNQILMRSKEMILKLNSRSNVSWEAGDLGYNLLVTSTLLTMIGEIKRALEIYRTYRGDNAYLAKDMLQSLGIAYSDIESNYALYRKRYVILAKRFNSAVVAPGDLSLFARKWFLATNIFADKHDVATLKQVYMFVSGGHFKLNSAGTALEYVAAYVKKSFQGGSASHTLSGDFALAESAMQSIIENPDFIEMYADLRAAFGSNLIQVPEDIEDQITFNVNELNRMQIHNIKSTPVIRLANNNGNFFCMADIIDINGNKLGCVGDVHQDSSGYLYQGATQLGMSELRLYKNSIGTVGQSTLIDASDNLTAYGTAFKGAVEFAYAGHICDSVSEKVTGDDILDMTRMIATQLTFGGATKITGESANQHVVAIKGIWGTEVVVHGTMWLHYDQNSTYPFYFGSFMSFAWAMSSTTENIDTLLVKTALSTYHSDFDWCGCAQSKFFDEDDQTYIDAEEYLFDMDNAFYISADTLHNIHEACVLSEFYLTDSTFNGSGR